MKVKELIEQLKQLSQDDDIIIIAMNDEFHALILKFTALMMTGKRKK